VPQALLLVLDLGGTFVFAVSGAMAAVKHRLDMFGVLVSSFIAGSGGGILRDLLIGVIPPAAIVDWKYAGVSAMAGLSVFFWHPKAERFRNDILWCDTVGLAFFAVVGAQKALLHGLNQAMAALLGMLAGIGGGMLRDVLVSEIPIVLRTDLYGLAALAGATVVVIAPLAQIPFAVAAMAGGLVCFALRFGAIRYGWHLPLARSTRLRRSPRTRRAAHQGLGESDPK
jgi:uncharacterized membrane protein YeiH